MEGFGVTEMKKIRYIKDDIDLIPENYMQLKRSVSGFYGKDGRDGFNNLILTGYLTELTGNWGKTFNSTAFYPTFEIFYNKIMKGREKIVDSVIEKILEEHKDYPGISKFMVHASFIARMGNTYYGNKAEERIINRFNHLKDYITCTKTDKKIDTELKVDAIVELVSVDSFGIQIKPESNRSYDKGEELPLHQEFTRKTGMKVVYVYYEKDEIIINNERMLLSDDVKILNMLQNIVYS